MPSHYCFMYSSRTMDKAITDKQDNLFRQIKDGPIFYFHFIQECGKEKSNNSHRCSSDLHLAYQSDQGIFQQLILAAIEAAAALFILRCRVRPETYPHIRRREQTTKAWLFPFLLIPFRQFPGQ